VLSLMGAIQITEDPPENSAYCPTCDRYWPRNNWLTRQIVAFNEYFDQEENHHWSDSILQGYVANSFQILDVFECPGCFYWILEDDFNTGGFATWKCSECDKVYHEFAKAVTCCERVTLQFTPVQETMLQQTTSVSMPTVPVSYRNTTTGITVTVQMPLQVDGKNTLS
jgi:transposase-like protein